MKQNFNPEIWLVDRKPFDPCKWLNNQKPVKITLPVIVFNNDKMHDVEIIVQRIEECRLDLTCDQRDWVKLGFAFASEFGEAGRSFYHRICSFYLGYNHSETDRQFDKCLKGDRSRASIKSFFFAAKEAGVNVLVKPQS